MEYFRRLKLAAEVPDTVPIDPAVGDPEAARLLTALQAGDWPAAERVLAAVDPEDLSFYTAVGSDVQGIETWLPDAVRSAERNDLALLMYGARAIGWAWDARGAARARFVTPERFELFFSRLRLAEDCLQEVVRRQPDNVAAWYHLIITARGLQLGIDEAWRRFERVVTRYPHHPGAHGQLLQQLCPKWSGSFEAMHDFARQAVESAPPGTRLGYLIADAHLEHWLELKDGEDKRYITSRAVRDSLHAAANHSIRHPDYPHRPGWLIAYNTFTAAFSIAGEMPAAVELFRFLDGRATQSPWEYLKGGAGPAFCSWWTVALRSAG